MSQYSVIASTTGSTQVRSGRGNAPWMTEGGDYLAIVNMGPSRGSNWAIWSANIPNALAGEAITNIRFRGGHDYTVAEGGLGYSRVVSVGVGFQRSVNAFIDVAGGTAIGSRPGTGTGANVDATVPITGYTSDDLRTGSLFIGIIAWTDGGDSTFPYDKYRMGIITWDIYTGNTTPAPPVSDPFGTMNNPTANRNPGKFAGQQFASVSVGFSENGHGIQTFMDYYWTITGPSGGVTFASTGTQSWKDTSGNYYKPAFEWRNSYSGLINIALDAKPGTYVINCWVDDRINAPDVRLSSQLVVRPRYDQLTEF